MTNNTTGALSVIEAYIEKSGIDASEEELPLQSHSVEYVYEAIKRTLNLHPDDYRSARAAMRFILNKHEKAMLDISCPLYKKEKYDE